MLFVLLKKKIFLRFCLCIFESDTVKSDCPVQIFRKMMKCLIQTVDVYLTKLYCFFSGDIKKKKNSKKKSSENDQSTGHFQSFFIFFSPLDPKSEFFLPQIN